MIDGYPSSKEEDPTLSILLDCGRSPRSWSLIMEWTIGDGHAMDHDAGGNEIVRRFPNSVGRQQSGPAVRMIAANSRIEDAFPLRDLWGPSSVASITNHLQISRISVVTSRFSRQWSSSNLLVLQTIWSSMIFIILDLSIVLPGRTTYWSLSL